MTIVLVHRDDEPVAPVLLERLRHGLSTPAGGCRIVVVDCSGPAGPFRAPADVEVIGSAPSSKTAAARNRGAAIADSPFVAFLDVRAEPHPEWLVEGVDLFRVDGSLVAVTPPDGRGMAATSFTALPGRRDPSAHAPTIASEVLAPAAHAAVFDTSTFLDLDGYDETLRIDGASIDIGWRAWIAGHRILRAPSATVPSVAAADLGDDDQVERFRHVQRDALATAFKCYDDENLAVALPACLLLVAERGRRKGAAYAAAAARATAEFSALLPTLRNERIAAQSRRRRTDAELLRLFRSPLEPAEGDEALGPEYALAVESFSLNDRFGTARRILVATPDVLTTKMAGPAIRAWQIAEALSVEHDVTLVTTSPVCEIGSSRFSVEAADDGRLRELERWADVIVLQGFVLEGRPYLRDTGKVMVVDIYDPLHLEQLELERDADDWRRRLTVRNATRVLNEQLARGDFFICASPKQRDFWLGQMSALGRINPLTYDEDETLRALLAIVPFGLPDHLPTHRARSLKGVVPGIAPTDEVILWGGGIYNWFDPLTLIRALDLLRRRRPQVRLFFMGMKHPNPEVAEMRMANASRQLSDELGLTNTHVFFNEGWVAYEDRQNFLLEADVGVSTHLDHVETAFSFRTRILDYIWATVPIVATSGDAFAELIENEKLGLTVPAGDVEALEAALFRLLDDREVAELCRKRLAAIRPSFTWSVVLEPLLDFCRNARRAPDLVDEEMAGTLRPTPVVEQQLGLSDPVPATSLRRLARTHLDEGGLPRLTSAIARRAIRALPLR